MDDYNLNISNNVNWRIKNHQFSLTDVKNTVRHGNKVNFGSENSTSVYYSKDYRVVTENNCVLTVFENKRNSRFDILRYNKQTVEQLNYKIEKTNDYYAMCELAELYLDDGFGIKDVGKAFDLFLRAADKGSSHAMCKIAQLYESGDLGKPDMEKSNEWMLKSADRGNVFALGVTGQRLLTEYSENKHKGQTSDKDIEKIFYYLEAATAKGSTRALWTLGHIHEEGLLGSKDLEKAIECYSNAAKSGSPASVESLHSLCLQNLYSCEKLEDILNGLVGYLAKSSIGMLFQLGTSCLNSEVGFSRARGLNMVEAAVLNKHGYDEAIKTLIDCYKLGVACDPDLRLCQYWYNELYLLYKISSDQGNLKSLWKMGQFHLEGLIGDIDLEKAELYFKKVVSSSNDPSFKFKLGEMFSKGILGDKDINLGVELRKEALLAKEQKALDNNFVECLSVGLMYLNSYYSFSSYEKAYYWLSKGAEGGVTEAEFLLVELYFNKNSGYTDLPRGLEIIKKLILSDYEFHEQGFRTINNYLTFNDAEYVSWLKDNSELIITAEHGNEESDKEMSNRKILKLKCLLKLTTGFDLGNLGTAIDTEMACFLWYTLVTEFKRITYIRKLTEAFECGNLPSELNSFISDWIVKLPVLLEEAQDFYFFFYCSLLEEYLLQGKLITSDLLGSAKYFCINALYKLPQDQVATHNILDDLSEKYFSVVQELKVSGLVATEICRLAEKFKMSCLLLYKILCRVLGDIFYGGFIAEQDICKAILWYSRASELNNSRATLTLAEIYRLSHKKNVYRSLKYYKLAVKQGSEKAVKGILSLVEENEMFKTHLPFLDNYRHKSSIPPHIIMKTPPHKNLSNYPSNGYEMYELAMKYLSNSKTDRQNLLNAVYWLRKGVVKANLDSIVELFIIYRTGMLGQKVVPVADTIKINLIKECRKKIRTVKDLCKDNAALKLEIMASLSPLKKILDDPTIRGIIEHLQKCVVPGKILEPEHLDEIITICDKFIADSESHMQIKGNYNPDVMP